MNLRAFLDPLFLTTLAGSLLLLWMLLLFLFEDLRFDEEPEGPPADGDITPIGSRPDPSGPIPAAPPAPHDAPPASPPRRAA